MMERSRDRRRVLQALGVAGALALAPAMAGAQGGEPWRIGAALDVTGGASFLGKPEHNAIVLAVEQANAAGGIRGRKIELAFQDTKSTETDSVLAVRKLISQDKVLALIGTSRTGGAMAILPIATEAEVPMLAPVSGVAVVEPVAQRKWIFRPGQGGDLSVGKVLDYAKRAGWTRLGVLYSADAYGEDGRDNMRKLAPGAGVAITREESFPPASTDLKPQLAKLSAAGVDAVFMHGLGAPSAIVYRNARELGLKPPIISGHGQANSAFRNAVGNAVVGQPIVGAPVLVWDELPDSHPQKKVAADFVEAYTKRFDAAPDMFAGVAYDAAQMVLQAIRETDGERAQIRDWLENKVKDYVGITGVFNFSPADHAGLKSDALVMMIATEDGWRLADYEK
ncbi:MAG: ABC transporter substrate-binding protein [Gemmatimonadales bacterium]|nr:ABC transporter substrate-binding protein [Gemmatimonadales bacterium]